MRYSRSKNALDNRTTTYEAHPADPIVPDRFADADITGEESDRREAESPRTAKNSTKRAIREIIETVLLALVIFVGVRALVLNFKVDGKSMMPSLINDEMLLVNRNLYFHFDLNDVRNLLPGDDTEEEDIVYPFHPPERGDIVVFNPPLDVPSTEPYIKRVIGLAGEKVEIQNGRVSVDGVELDEPYAQGITECRRPSECATVTVPEGEIFVLGDNREDSSDSRVFGPVEVDDVIGKAWITYWPLDEFDIVPHYDYPELSA